MSSRAMAGIRLLYVASPSHRLHCSNVHHDPQKLIQYSMKLYLLGHATFRGKLSPLKALGPLEKSILRRLNSTVSSLSMTR